MAFVNGTMGLQADGQALACHSARGLYAMQLLQQASTAWTGRLGSNNVVPWIDGCHVASESPRLFVRCDTAILGLHAHCRLCLLSRDRELWFAQSFGREDRVFGAMF